jgi:hypothetical protein
MMTMNGVITKAPQSKPSLMGLIGGLAALGSLVLVFAFIPTAQKGFCQLAFVPFIIFASVRIGVLGVRIPRLIPVLTAVGAVLGAVSQFWHVNLASGAFLVSTVGDQDLRQETKIYRDRIRRSVSSDAESLIGLYPGAISDFSAAQRLLDKGSYLGGVIWGNSRWMNVALRRYEPLKLSSFPETSVAQTLLVNRGIPDLMLIRSVPIVGLSHGQERGSVRFIGEIVRAWHSIPKMLLPKVDSSEFEGALEAAARLQVRWTSRSHLALPLWLAGTAHLIRALEAADLQPGELRCALNELKDALSLFRTHDNPALEMSVRNTYAIALLLQSEGSPEFGKLQKKALQQLAAASRLRKYNGEIGGVVGLNYLGLAQSIKVGIVYDRKK